MCVYFRQMKSHNLLTIILISVIILLPKKQTSADHFQYEACAPINCGLGPNVSFPFYVPGRQESYCGLPEFELNCSPEGGRYPLLRFPESENEYVVDRIHYRNRSFHVYIAAALRPVSNGDTCGIQNTILPFRFGFAANTSWVYLFSGCPDPLPRNLSRYSISNSNCDSWDLAIYDGDGNLEDALRNCERNVVLPVGGYEGRNVIPNVTEVLQTGFELNWTASDCSECQDSGGRCGFNATTYHFRCFCPDRPHSRSCIPMRNRRLVLIASTAAGTLAALTLVVAVVFILIQRGYSFFGLQKAKTKQELEIELFLKDYGNIMPKRYKYSDLKKMTKSFLENLGKGGYGTVYKGVLPNGHQVAVKILNESKGNGEEFMNEVASISRTSHINVVTLVGFCYAGSKRALIYDFMTNGSLEKYLQNTSECVLGWEKLFEISLGIARGLDYLHQGCNTRILHFDIKPHNILLDKDFNPKISDFGLAKLCPNRSSIVSMLVARGTIGYIAPEVFCRNFGEVSYKSDVYSYGMMVLEIAGEKRGIDRGDVDHTSETYFPQYIYKELERMDIERHGEHDGITTNEDGSAGLSKRKLIIVGLWCVQTDPKDRPSMSKVVEMLEGKLESLQVPPKPYMSSPPRLALDFSIASSSV